MGPEDIATTEETTICMTTPDGSEPPSDSYLTLDEMELVATEHNISIYPDVEAELAQVQETLGKLNGFASIDPIIKTSSDIPLRTAAAFYLTEIRPLVATGRDAYKPTTQEIMELCQRLASGEPVNFVIYYALSKTMSPSRTGSPDIAIDFAELEMLSYYSQITQVAERLGFNMRVLILDETSIIDDQCLGFSAEAKLHNMLVATGYLRTSGAEKLVIVKPLRDSVEDILGTQFQPEYERAYQIQKEELQREVLAGVTHPDTIRMAILLDCTPDSGLIALSIRPEDIGAVRFAGKPHCLACLPLDVLNRLIHITAHVKAYMSLRDLAKEIATRQGKLAEFPEYDEDTRLYSGVTRSTHRWSFVPHPVRYQGQTRNPMHGIAAYTANGQSPRPFLGVLSYNDLTKRQGAYIYRHGSKPILALI